MSKLLSDLSKGTWSGATAYTIGDIVDNDGSSYVCVANTTNNEPPNATYWALLASKGADAAQSISGGVENNIVTIDAVGDSKDSGIPISSIPSKATGAEVNTGTDDSKYVTAKAVEDSDYIKGTSPTITSPTINTGVSGTAILDEDDMASNSATKLATQQSIKAYVDNTQVFDWKSYTTVTPTTGTFDAPSYPIVFAGVDLTTTLYPGMKVKITQSTVKYFIITKVSFSTDTTVTLYGGTDYSLVASGTTAISAFSYSVSKSPSGFPTEPTKWTVETTDTSNRTQSSPTQNTWYNLGSVTQAIPIGAWDVQYFVVARTSKSGAADIYTTLSTANNSESDADFTCFIQNDATQDLILSVNKRKTLALTSKTSYYLNSKTSVASVTTIGNNGNLVKTIIRSICAYL